MNEQMIQDFQATVWDYYTKQGRHDLPWRHAEPDGMFDPYKILVSELMLQQTQVPRVIPKFQEFIRQFPDSKTLAQSPQQAVLAAWSGLGYNRRARFLQQAAQMIEREFDGVVPRSIDDLIRLPGVGRNTAGAVVTYAFNEPVVFIETNIRTVLLHHFLAGQDAVDDKTIAELVAATLDHEQPREWYWALMDYGSFLKQTAGNASRNSKHYVKQSRFEGSRRQLRGRIIKELTAGAKPEAAVLAELEDERTASVLADLIAEGLVVKTGDHLSL